MVSAQGKSSVQKSAYLEGFGNVVDQGDKGDMHGGIVGNGVDKRAPPGFDAPKLYGPYGTSYQGAKDVNSKAPWLDGLVYYGGRRFVEFHDKQGGKNGDRMGVKNGPPGFDRKYGSVKHGKKRKLLFTFNLQ